MVYLYAYICYSSYIWLISFGKCIGRYTIHGSSGNEILDLVDPEFVLAPLGRSQLFVGPKIFLWELFVFP